ncbi:MAG: SIMPL domain-containing protein [Bacteroidota bacterium]
MKEITKIILFTLLFTNIINAQSTDRFIRIIGNSSYEFNADTYRVYFNVSEILPNNYNKEEYKSLESNVSETLDNLKKMGVKENHIFKNYKSKNANNYNNTKVEYYYIDVTSKELLNKITGMKNTGFKMETTKFLYLNINPDIETNLSKEAITDAERKAKSITKEIGKKLGKILNIEDKTTACCSDFGETEQNSILKKYSLNITFELLD